MSSPVKHIKISNTELVGIERGKNDRLKYCFDSLDVYNGHVCLEFDSKIEFATSSYFIGLLKDSVNAFKTKEDFLNHYYTNSHYLVDDVFRDITQYLAIK